MGSIKKVLITFDVDFVDYLTETNLDEMEIVFPMIKKILQEHAGVKTTWFIRIDSQIEKLHGTGDFLYNKHIDKINWLLDNGHSIGWHHHAYMLSAGKWIQNTNEDTVLKEINKYGSLAREKGLDVCRMGWGFHTNQTMKLVSDLGFTIDSSAIPRPNYKWEMSVKDWQSTPLFWYHPSCDDYRVEGIPCLPILEAPISTTVLPLSTDTEESVVRYLNTAYHQEQFSKAFNSLQQLDRIMTITHPYELMHTDSIHPLLSFDINTLKENISFIKESGCSFEVIK